MKEFINDGLVELTDTQMVMTGLGREFTPRICEVFDSYAGRDLYDHTLQKVFQMVPESVD